MKKKLLLLNAIMIIACSCNKTKQTTKKIYGDYTLSTYTVNGVDSLCSYKDSLGVKYDFFYDDYQEDTFCKIYGVRNDGIEKTFGWTWGLVNITTLKVFTAFGNIIGIGPFGKDITPTWEILNLTNNNLKLKTNYNNKEYFIELDKK
jgi:hypothetical protein